jgi:hypothetical protein
MGEIVDQYNNHHKNNKKLINIKIAGGISIEAPFSIANTKFPSGER